MSRDRLSFAKLGLVFGAFILAGCQTVVRNEFPKEELESKAPFQVVFDAVDEPLIDINTIGDQGAMMIGYQGGAIGGALASLAVEARHAEQRREIKNALGENWTLVEKVNDDQLLNEAIRNFASEQEISWFASFREDQGMDHRSLNQKASEYSGSTLGVISWVEYSSDLCGAKFYSRYQAYWKNQSGEVEPMTRGDVAYVVLPRTFSTIESEGKIWWKDAYSTAEEFIRSGFQESVALILTDMQNLPQREQTIRIKLWNFDGYFLGKISKHRLLLREPYYSGGLLSIPIPPIAYRELNSFALLRMDESDLKYREILAKVIRESGSTVTVVDNAAEAESVDALVEYRIQEGWDLFTFVKSISLVIKDPSTDEVLNARILNTQGGSKFVKPKADEAIQLAWQEVMADQLKTALRE